MKTVMVPGGDQAAGGIGFLEKRLSVWVAPGVLAEVPVMLSLVACANRTRGHFPG